MNGRLRLWEFHESDLDALAAMVGDAQAVLESRGRHASSWNASDPAVNRFEISRLVALVHEDHVASRRVAENIGMREERRTLLEGDYPAIVHAADLERSATVTRTPA